MRVARARHRHRVLVVLQAVGGLVLDGRVDLLLRHAGLEAAALHHEAVDDAVEDRAVVMPALDVLDEVLRGLRGLLLVEFERDHAVLRDVEFDFRVRHVETPYWTMVADWMMTGVLGTSLGIGPPGPVATALILFTVSMPLTT